MISVELGLKDAVFVVSSKLVIMLYRPMDRMECRTSASRSSIPCPTALRTATEVMSLDIEAMAEIVESV